MGHSNYKLSDEQKKELDILSEEMIKEFESKLLGYDIGGILDPYNGREFNNNKFTAMVWYIGEQLSYY